MSNPACYSSQAEQAIIGSLLLDNTTWDDVQQKQLTFKDFYRREHQVLFDLISKKLVQGECIDALMLQDEIKLIPELKDLNIELYVLELLRQTYRTSNITSYAEIVKEHSQRRQFKEVLGYLDKHANEGDIKTLVQQAHQELAHLVYAPLPEHHGISYQRFLDIEPQAINWLWPNQIARGKVSIIAGNPGLGKSQITAYMAAVVSSGGVWPVEQTQCQSGGVIFLSAEDDPADTIRPRLEAVGAYLNKVYIIKLVKNKKQDKEVKRSFNLKTDLPNLEKLLNELKDIALIIIDPITAYLGQTDSYNNAEVRNLLMPLSDLAAKYNVAVVAVSHLNKNSGQDPLLRVAGSLAFVAAARTAFVVTHDPNDKKRRFLFPVKNNIAEDKNGFAFSIQSCWLDNNQFGSSKIVWEDEMISEEVMNTMSSSSEPEDNSILKEAIDFLSNELAYSARSVSQLKKATNEYGLSWASVIRAKTALRIIPKKSAFTGGWMWSLPDELKKDNQQNKLVPFKEPISDLSKEIKNPNTKNLISLISFGEEDHLGQDLNKIEDEIEQNLNTNNVVVEEDQGDQIICEGDIDHLQQNLNSSENEQDFYIDIQQGEDNDAY
ncbi:AAA family ATPase [Rickettsiella endosymbiont of Dermanyssus gallinae]|uniref:AAA family ATPase n=1 Tax=Rickettsiella endosymbiont of Dermanyssus gallinae TaxID=2856608 RepID=UPI001C529D60|nr:AAA family ATPase [Rickettsiella endosymbiont of Dermanyssus gallinae]